MINQLNLFSNNFTLAFFDNHCSILNFNTIKSDPWPYQEEKPLEANVTTGGDTSKFQNRHSQNARTVMH